jgi:hypothetical protein
VLVLGAAGNLLGIVRGDGAASSQHLYGEITVPSLGHLSAIGERGHDRTLHLNPGHPVAAALAAFVGATIREFGGILAAGDQTAGWYRRLLQT